jgi:hypothetical protein
MEMKKTYVYSAAAAALAFTGWQAKKLIFNQRREAVPFSRILKDDNFEIRFYPAHVVASVVLHGSYSEIMRKGIHLLNNYIHSHNNLDQRLEHVKPYVVIYDEMNKLGTIHLPMPKAYPADRLPIPDAENIHIHTLDAEYKAVLKTSGSLTESEMFEKSAELINLLDLKGMDYDDQIEHLYYNDPLQLLGKKFEIAVPIHNFE